MEEKQQRWCLERHKRVRKIFAFPIWALTHLRYPVQIEKAPDDSQALILFNHQTALDQFLVGLPFPSRCTMWPRRICFPSDPWPGLWNIWWRPSPSTNSPRTSGR